VFRNEQGDTALSWRIRLADARIAQAVYEDLELHSALALRVLQHGTELEILASDTARVLDGWRGTSPDACPPVGER
jgi:hypothetical protein